MRTLTITILVLMMAIVGCSDDQKVELEKRNMELAQELVSRDKFIEEVTLSMSEIHDKLESVWAKQKNIMRQASKSEGGKTLTPMEIKQQALNRISDLSSILASNRTKLSDLQKKLSESRTQYTGLEKMVEDLKNQLEESERSVAEMTTRIQNLEGEVSEKVQIIAARDMTIENQSKELKKALYVLGTRDELEQKGVIEEEGGFLWGLIGSTTILAPTFTVDNFHGVDKMEALSIEIPGRIEELVPKRDENSYEQQLLADGHTLLKITNPGSFWRQSHLVIISDKPSQ